MYCIQELSLYILGFHAGLLKWSEAQGTTGQEKVLNMLSGSKCHLQTSASNSRPRIKRTGMLLTLFEILTRMLSAGGAGDELIKEFPCLLLRFEHAGQ